MITRRRVEDVEDLVDCRTGNLGDATPTRHAASPARRPSSGMDACGIIGLR